MGESSKGISKNLELISMREQMRGLAHSFLEANHWSTHELSTYLVKDGFHPNVSQSKLEILY